MLIIDRRGIILGKYTAPVLLPVLLKQNPVLSSWSCSSQYGLTNHIYEDEMLPFLQIFFKTLLKVRKQR